jgi:hypothetical protein
VSKFTGRLNFPPTANDAMVWDGTEFRPTRSVTMNPVIGQVSAAMLALAIGTAIDDTHRIGFLPDTSVVGSEKLTTYVGGVAGPKLTLVGGVVNLDLQGGGLTAASVTNSALTSGRVPFSAAAGLQTDGAGLTYTANALVVGDGTGAASLIANGSTGQSRGLSIKTAGVSRWQFVGNSTAEGGSNAGTDLLVRALDDAGSTIDNPIVITRASGGAITLVRPLQPGSGSAGAPSYAFSTDTTTGFFRTSSGSIGVASAGVEMIRLGATQFTFSRNAVAINTAPITTVGTLTVHAADGVSASLSLCSYGQNSILIARRANGTAGALTALASADPIFTLQLFGYESTTPGFTSSKSAYQVVASEAWTSAAMGFRHQWHGIVNGTISAGERMRLENSGNLLIGTTTDGLTAAGSIAIAQDLAHRGTNLGLFNTAPTTKKTGYGTPTGNAYQASFAAGSITLPNLAAAVAQLIIDLKAYGLIGA